QRIILLNGEDVSQAIREHYVSKLASDVSKIPQVRKFLVAMQRKIAETTDVVLDGRDITSYVLPNAKFKFYLTATAEERATRRYKELTAKGQEVDFDRILNDIIDRDYNDMNRDFAPLVQTQDSVYIDSTHLSIDEVAAIIIGTVTGATKA
ncbi:MAG: (d)CMP kinase, partial [Christensenellales bacterium]